jgi:hypothetical protein
VTARKWGVPVIVCGPHYEKVVYPNDRMANVRAECCGLPDAIARKEGCEAARDRMMECAGPGRVPCPSANDAMRRGPWYVSEHTVRHCDDAAACPLQATLPRATVAR